MATETVNEMLHDALVRRQIALSRYSQGLSADVIKLIDDTEDDVRRELERRLAKLGVNFTSATHSRLNVLESALREIRNPAFDKAGNLLSGSMKSVATDEADYLKTVMQDLSPVKLDLILPDSEDLESMVETQPFEGKLLRDWADSIKEADLTRMLDEIRVGMASGKTTPNIVRSILGTETANGADGVVNLTRRDATSVTRTAVATFAGEARQAFMDKNDDVIQDERFTATLDSRTTIQCAALDGKIFKVGEGPQPPLHWNCRSLRVPVFDGKVLGARPAKAVTEEELEGLSKQERRALINEKTGQVSASTTYAEWLKRQSSEFQDSVLGPERAALFRSGDISLDKFINRDGDVISLNELKTMGRGTHFVSPNVSNLTFTEAVEALGDPRQAEVMVLNDRIDKLMGMRADSTGVIGAWADGAENSIMTRIKAGESWDDIRAAAAMKGMVADQKAVLAFQSGGGTGKDFVGSFSLNGKLDEVHKSLLDNGLPFHTLERTGKDGVKVFVFGQDEDALKALNKAGKAYGKAINVEFGRGEFIGSALQEGADAAIRADARKAYEAALQPWLSLQPKSVRDEWRSIANAGDSLSTRTAGLKAFGVADAKRVSDAWVKSSPIKSIDDLYARAKEMNEGLIAVANSAAEESGATYRAAGIKKLPRVLEKMAQKEYSPAEISDIVRGTFEVKSPAQADKVVAALAKKYPIIDEGWRVTPAGYFDRPLKVLLPNGQTGEVLVAPPALLAAKSSKGGGHDLYVKWRSMPNKNTPEALAMQRQMIDLYGKARASLGEEWGPVVDSFHETLRKEEQSISKVAFTPRASHEAEGISTEEFEEIVKMKHDVSKDLKFDDGKVLVSDESKIFILNGVAYFYGGSADLETGDITIYGDKVDKKSAPGIIAQEIMHNKFQTVMDRYSQEARVIRSMPGKILKADGELANQALKVQFPIYDSMFKLFSARLADEGNITPYSTEWWSAWRNNQVTMQQAIQQTLADMARVRYESGKTVGPPVWREMYKVVNQNYAAVQRISASGRA